MTDINRVSCEDAYIPSQDSTQDSKIFRFPARGKLELRLGGGGA